METGLYAVTCTRAPSVTESGSSAACTPCRTADLDPPVVPGIGPWADRDDPGEPDRHGVLRAACVRSQTPARRAGGDLDGQQRIHIAQPEPPDMGAPASDQGDEVERRRGPRVRLVVAAGTGCRGLVRAPHLVRHQAHREHHRQRRHDDPGLRPPRGPFGPWTAAQHLLVDAPIAGVIGQRAFSRHPGVTSEPARAPSSYPGRSSTVHGPDPSLLLMVHARYRCARLHDQGGPVRLCRRSHPWLCKPCFTPRAARGASPGARRRPTGPSRSLSSQVVHRSGSGPSGPGR